MRAADQVLSRRFAARRVEEPRELHCGLDRVAHAARQEDLRTRLWSKRGQALAELPRRPAGKIAEHVERRQFRELLRDGLRNLAVTVTHVRVPQARGAVDIAPPLLVPHE